MATGASSYGQILKSSSIIGGAKAITYLCSLVRVKLVAVLIGPAGVGMVGLYYSAIELVGVVSSLGIATSAGREVAQCHAKGDATSLARTIKVLRRCCWFTGILGWLLSASLALPLSHWIFDTGEHAWAIAIVGSSLLLKTVSEGQSTVIGGMRRMADLARISILSAILSTIAALAVYGWLREDGIVPVIILTAAINLFSSWFYARRISLQNEALSWVETGRHARRFMGLGIAVVWTVVISSVVSLILRSQIATRLGLDAVGIFSAASNLSILFAGFVLGAMAADYFPRLSAVAEDMPQLNQLINEQMEIGLLLVLPGIIGTLAYAPWIMTLFYSSKFISGAELLPWLIVGVFGRIVSWPMAYAMMARGESRWYAASESFFGILHLVIALVLIRSLGLVGMAISYPIIYAVYTLGLLWLLKRLTGFTLTSSLLKLLAISATMVITGFLANAFLPTTYGAIIGTLVTMASAIFCLRSLASRLGLNHRLVKMICRLPLGRLVCGV
jgi:PST family polysaccharide transporter